MTTGLANVIDAASWFQASNQVTAAGLLSRIRSGDAAAWDKIISRYGKLVTTTVRSFQLQEADALDAVQMTWLRLAENAHRIPFPERLGGWLATTARRECLYILRQVRLLPRLDDVIPDTVADPSVGPEQHVMHADTVQKLRRLVAELPPRRRTVVRMLFTEQPCSYAEIARATGIPAGGIGPTRTRALRQLRDRLCEYELGLESANTKNAEGEKTEGNRTGSYLLDDLFNKADHALREKLDPKISESEVDSNWSTGDARLDNLLHKADAALRAILGHQ